MPQATVKPRPSTPPTLADGWLRRIFGEIVTGTGPVASCIHCRHLIPIDPELPHVQRCQAAPLEGDPLA